MTIPENVDLGIKGRFGVVNFNALKDGVKQSELKNPEQIMLFNKIDKDGNGIISENELQELVTSLGNYAEDGKITRREAGKFLKANGLKGEIKRKQVFDFLNQFGILSDNIADTTTSIRDDGTKTINVEYKPNDAGEIITEIINEGTGNLYGKKTVKDGKTVTQYFTEDGKIKQENTEENGVTTITKYDENGNITSAIRKKGSVTEILDADGRVVKKQTDKGFGIKEIVEYEYDDNGNVAKTTTTNADGTKIIDDGVSVTTINTDGSKTVKNKETGEIQEFDKDGKLIKPEDSAQETPEPYKHKTQLGDTWYGIVQAKYGITDHKQTMEIVHQLKAQNNVSLSATNMPKEVLLPDTITLKDGTEVKLTDKDAVVDTSHNNITNANHSYNLRSEREDLDEEIREQAEKNEALRKEGAKIAKALYEDMKGLGTSNTFSTNLKEITKDNAAAVVLGYREVSNEESLTEAILDEVGKSKLSRREALKGIFNKLVEKAKEQGLDTTQFEEQFNAQIDDATTWGSDKFDPIFEGLASGINGALILTSKDIKDIQNMSANEKKDYTITQLDNVLESSQKSFENQLATDGWAGKTHELSEAGFTKGFYKTHNIFDSNVDSWLTRHDPLTFYFDETVSDEMLDAIATVTDKYKRIPQRKLPGALDGCPWIAHEKYVTRAEIEALIQNAEKVNPEIAKALKSDAGYDYNMSTGEFNSYKKLLSDFQRYTAIAPKISVAKLPELNENELVRVAGNNGKPINADYIRTSREARQYLFDAIDSGKYSESLESYIETMNNMHIVSARGKNGTSDWYSQVGDGSNNVNPGVIRGEGSFRNSRREEAGLIEDIAKKYGDPYRVTQSSKVKLTGIPDEYLPFDEAIGDLYYHYYPDGKSLNFYYKEMHRTSKEALNLIANTAPEREILSKIAEHYQYAANARPYGQINNSLFMNEINTMLTKAGLKTMPHGILDHAAQRLQPDTFKKYFIDQYYATALT